jgi:hypothetical protein
MKKKICALAVMLIANSFRVLPAAHAADFAFQPRLETGLMYYSIELAAQSETMLSNPGESAGYNLGQEKIEFSDNLGFVSGGATLFFNRIFVDLSGQYAFNGNGRSQASSFEYGETVNLFYSSAAEYHGQFHRTDLAVSAGYAVTPGFSVYAGYKWAALDLDTTFDGQASLLDIDNYVANGRIAGEDHYKFKYEGPFIGLTQGWKIDNPGIFNGLISAKLALAYLSSKLNQAQTGSLRFYSINGVAIEPITFPIDERTEVKGDTLGLALGFEWHGTTSIKSLSYGISVSGYRYNFDSDDSAFPDISETAVICRVGLTYLFN